MDDGPRPFPNHPGGRPTGSLPICIPRVPQEAYRGDGESFFLMSLLLQSLQVLVEKMLDVSQGRPLPVQALHVPPQGI